MKKINKIDKPLARITNKKSEDTFKIRNERREITTGYHRDTKVIR